MTGGFEAFPNFDVIDKSYDVPKLVLIGTMAVKLNKFVGHHMLNTILGVAKAAKVYTAVNLFCHFFKELFFIKTFLLKITNT